jgi:predicted transcriptional regulator
MKIDKDDIKHRIDAAAELLKDATDHISEESLKAAEKAHEKRIELTVKAGDKLIEVGQKLKDSTRDSTTVQRPEVPGPIR